MIANPMRWTRIASLLAALLIGGIIGVRWWGNTPQSAPQASPTPAPAAATPSPASDASAADEAAPQASPRPFLQLEGTNLSGVDPQGRRVWELRAKTLSVDRDRQQIVLTAVTGQFFRDARSQFDFSAPKARFHVDSRRVELWGGIQARARDGRRLRAARIVYQGTQDVLVATGDVQLTQPGMFIRADQLTTDLALSRPKFSGNIIVRVSE